MRSVQLATGLSSLITLTNILQVSQGWEDWSFTTPGIPNPRERAGHSMVTQQNKVVMFGGRGNEKHRSHITKTYKIVEEDGMMDFETYDDEPLLPNFDPMCKAEINCLSQENNENLTSSSQNEHNEEDCSYSWKHHLKETMTEDEKEFKEEECGFVHTGHYYNDIWVFDLDCKRFQDQPCEKSGWKLLHPGMKYGNCRDDTNGHRVCENPSERWGHSAVMFDNETMVIYGGYSHECEDYCSDMWSFDFKSLKWKIISYGDMYIEQNENYPGKRWNFSLVRGTDKLDNPIIIMFGGHRLWQGFAQDNDQEILPHSNDVNKLGGYLNDLWIFCKVEQEQAINLNNNFGFPKEGKFENYAWLKQSRKEICKDSPGAAWADRNNIHCTSNWPSTRSGHASIFDEPRNRMWIHGGFNSFYPYPSSSYLNNVQNINLSHKRKTYVPYASHSFYLNDLWFYDFSTRLWENVHPATPVIPLRRTNHILSHSGHMLIIHGGFSNNNHFNDTWFYYPEKNQWLEKKDHVHANFPISCRDDVKFIESDPSCIELTFPQPLRRSTHTTYTIKDQDILPFKEQPRVTPDEVNPLYFGIVDDAENYVAELRKEFLENEVYDNEGKRVWIKSNILDGTQIAPHAASSLRQYAREKKIMFNSTLSLDIWEWCTSVKGEPTRGVVTDGNFGRSRKTILIPQRRRQSPGWDGCRELNWVFPTSRSNHKGIFVPQYNMMFFYGGVGYTLSNKKGNHFELPSQSTKKTYETMILDDTWVLNLDSCLHNCSNHGICTNGFCRCDPGYYGLDCSNITCPGSVCYYDNYHSQHCSHCCYDGYNHTIQSSTYLSGLRKFPCKHKVDSHHEIQFTGSSNGICDGFGQCQCIPPFVGEDCSVKDCKNDCSFNGYCSLEFPTSRCICKEPYFGEYCQHIECLNNCSYPRGKCDYTSGKCSCAAIRSPHNKSNFWSSWQGEDCSYLPAWSSSQRFKLDNIVMFFLLLMIFAVYYIEGTE